MLSFCNQCYNIPRSALLFIFACLSVGWMSATSLHISVVPNSLFICSDLLVYRFVFRRTTVNSGSERLRREVCLGRDKHAGLPSHCESRILSVTRLEPEPRGQPRYRLHDDHSFTQLSCYCVISHYHTASTY